jgi:hypothetical protein
MAIFSKTKKLPDLRSRRDNLQIRLAAAETTLDGLRNDAVALASDDPGKLSDKADRDRLPIHSMNPSKEPRSCRSVAG